MKLGYPLPTSTCWVSVECAALGTKTRRRRVDLSRVSSVECLVSRVRGATRRLFNDTCGACRAGCDATKCLAAIHALGGGVFETPPFRGLEEVVGATWSAMRLEEAKPWPR